MITQSLPGTEAAKQLQHSMLQQLSSGELIQQATNSTSNTEEQTHLAAVLSCLAASPCRAKLCAMLAQSVSVAWAGHDQPTVAATAGTSKAGSKHAKPASTADDDLACSVCNRATPDHNMLLCDGCDAAYHTTCLLPVLPDIPEGDWFCPDCQVDIRSSTMEADDAIR